MQSLNDIKNLKCLISGEIANNFGALPNDSGTWWLYNQKTRFHYFKICQFQLVRKRNICFAIGIGKQLDRGLYILMPIPAKL